MIFMGYVSFREGTFPVLQIMGVTLGIPDSPGQPTKQVLQCHSVEVDAYIYIYVYDMYLPTFGI